jgi:FAD/FMN-containing dehydrogenase
METRCRPADALALLNIARNAAGTALTAFELIPRIGLETVLTHIPGTRDPLAGRHDWYVLLQIYSGRSQADADGLVETIFTAGMEKDLVEDGVRAETIEQAEAIWRLRHRPPATRRRRSPGTMCSISCAHSGGER